MGLNVADFTDVFFVPLLILLVIVVPLWIVFHYIFTKNTRARLSSDEKKQLESLQHQAETMKDRIKNLEEILDAKAPGWKSDP